MAAIPKKKKTAKRKPPPPPLGAPLVKPPPPVDKNALLFPSDSGDLILTYDWDSLKAAEPLTLPLNDYSPDGILKATSSNTLAIEFTTPGNSSRFCLSIAGDNKDENKVRVGGGGGYVGGQSEDVDPHSHPTNTALTTTSADL